MMKKILALGLIVALIGLPFPPARADDSDIFIFGAHIQPNVLIAIDTSGSMDDTIYADPYDINTTYDLHNSCTSGNDKVNCVAATVYKKKNGKYTVYADSIDAVTSSSARTALSTNGFWSGSIGGSTYNLYVGNYLNWLATPGAQQVAKITVAKQVLTKLVTNTEGVRFGLMRFTNNGNQGYGGGKILSPVGTDPATIITQINNLNSDGYTPLGEMLRNAGNYYKGGVGDYTGGYKTSPIQYECQANYIILMSDGLQNGHLDIRNEATTLFTSDYSDSLPGKQYVILDTVGFAISAADAADGANDIMQAAATNGGGNFYSTESQTQLEIALNDAISKIIEATFAFATPTIPSTKATGSTKAYLAAFQSDPSKPFWSGYLKAYQRDSSGNVPVDPATGLPTNAPVWEAGNVLTTMTASARNIYTQVGTSLVDFKTSTSTSTITPAMLGVATDTDRNKLIDFIRGVDTYNWFGNGTSADRPWKLGDIFHSTPVLVTQPLAPATDSGTGSYAEFKTTNAGRTPILLAGANDGMLHAFRDDTGQELWGFIPPDLLPSLKLLTVTGGDHPFFVDGNPIVADVKISIPSDATVKWRTIVVFGERRGGRQYHALDITDPANPIYMWKSFDDAKWGETWSSPAIGKVLMSDGTTKFVAFVGGGYDTGQNNNTGKAVFAIDLSTGNKLWEYYYAAGATNDSRYMNFSIPADVTAAAVSNNNGYIDRLYVGDVGGQVWKFDLSHPATLSGGLVTNWVGNRLFRADTTEANPPPNGEYYATQAIYGPVIPALDDLHHVWIYFGTGDLNHPNNNTAPNRFYGIIDNVAINSSNSPTTSLTESSLSDVTSASNVTVTQGWYYRMTARASGSTPTEKDLKGAEIFNKVVFFTTFVPTSTAACGSGGGTAKMYAVQMLNGYAGSDWSGNAPLTTTDASVSRSRDIGSGIPSKPVIVITDSGATVETSVVAATTSQQLPNNPAPPPNSMRKVLYWREIF